ncbi:MFS transporter [Cohnella hongkongensis]|uniref:MFS transporter n=1 Tax=Cohnella hongkongensis TaxID=178337 RepID=A0ABV9FCE1_9BACL
METRKKRDILSIATVPLTMTLANSMLIPVLPAMQRALRISSLQASWIITAYAAVAILFIPLAGYLSDRYGRKAVILPSLLLVCAAGAAAGFAAISGSPNAYGFILGARLLQGLGSAGCFPVVLPLVGDLFKKDDDVSQGLGLIETSNTFGKVVSPILGSALAMWTWYAPFFAIPAFGVISFLLVLLFVKPPKGSGSEKPERTGLGEFLRSVAKLIRTEGKWLYGIFAIGGISMFAIFGSLFYLSETLEQHGLKSVNKGLVLAIPLGGLCLVAFLSGKWIGKNKAKMKWTSLAGLTISTAALLALGLTNRDGIWWTVSMLTLSSSGIGAALPSLDALITEGIDKSQRGTVTSLYSSMRFIGVAAGPPVSALLMGVSSSALFLTAAAAGLVASLLNLFAIRPEKKDDAKG